MSTKTDILEYLTSHEGEYVSGEDLSRRLSVSRTAIWKGVETLRDDGYTVFATTNRGYCLRDDGGLSRRSLEALMPSRPIHFFQTVDSTNRVAKELAGTGAPDGTLVISRRQSVGRGRLGRSFFSPHGGIYLSLVFRPQGQGEDALLITGAAAVATALAIERECGKSCMIKWVNDLYWQGKKVTGILSEGVVDLESGSLSAIVVGIGINFCTQSADFPQEIRETAGSLYEGPSQVPPTVDQNRLVSFLVNSLSAYAGDLKARAFIGEYRNRNMLLGKTVVMLQGGKEQGTGVVEGIDDDGHLLLKKEDGGSLSLGTGEVTIRLARKASEWV